MDQQKPFAALASSPAHAPSAEHMAAIIAARARCRRVRRASTVASFSGWTMAVFAAITLLTAFFSTAALVLGLALAAVAWIELRGARQFRQMDHRAGRMLAFNQIALLAIVCVYGTWRIWNAVYGPGEYEAQIAAGGELAEMLVPIDRLTRVTTIALYTTLLFGSAIAQGCSAVYYATRRKHVVAFLRETPEWVTAAMRAAA